MRESYENALKSQISVSFTLQLPNQRLFKQLLVTVVEMSSE